MCTPQPLSQPPLPAQRRSGVRPEALAPPPSRPAVAAARGGETYADEAHGGARGGGGPGALEQAVGELGADPAGSSEALQRTQSQRDARERRRAATLAHLRGRPRASAAGQLAALLPRALLKQRRQWTWMGAPQPLLDLLLVLGAGLIVGAIHSGGYDVRAAPQQALMAMTTLGVLVTIVALRPLSSTHARALLARECAGGARPGPQLAALCMAALPAVALLPAAFLAGYYYTALPEAPVGDWYAAALGVSWWASGLALLVGALAPARASLVAGVFVALMFGAFFNGTHPTLAAARGGGGGGGGGGGAPTALTAALACSYNRWAMEALALSEFRQWGAARARAALSAARGLGLCRLDVLLPDNGDGRLSAAEAAAAARLQAEWSPAFCDGARAAALGALAAGGAALRLLAWGALRVTHGLPYWSQS
ncbi:hypothetical protein MNEG_7856 [Monoraphidium neglectum]|uniref:ABC-2 type transporter transmembrane domain-containing protein n=1 Tax=Monoraphidium neglectum TaxID=145388 RepID=A0A0D2KXY9_9CHLO|nr:hypothetical protein MNEG_7856 [Monoraphidium neglectum]KIZ00109.1 hypothetical protein MNEG_7856 [Monoraphidium neglectum]|eukprot:XP_013899128.1 hypothetical protein MNEG_7856 [Monoraphidium neglectum]